MSGAGQAAAAPLCDAIHIAPGDNVATALRELGSGETVRVRGAEGFFEIVAAARVPRCHKLAVVALASGEPVVKYGAPIGRMTRDAAPGAHVHVHNMVSQRAGEGDRR